MRTVWPATSGAPPKILLPKVVAEDCRLRGLPLLVVAGEGAAEDRAEAEGLEEAGADHGAFELPGLAVHAPAMRLRAADEEDGELLEGAVLVAVVAKIGRADRRLGVAVRRAAVTPIPGGGRRGRAGDSAARH